MCVSPLFVVAQMFKSYVPNLCQDGAPTPLHLAALSGDSSIVALLLAKQLRVNARDSVRWSRTGQKTSFCGLTWLHLTLQKGATPLHYAARSGCSHAVSLFIKDPRTDLRLRDIVSLWNTGTLGNLN